MFNTILSIAALGIVAFVLVFVHPASQASRASGRLTAAHDGAAAAMAVVTHASPRLAASK